MCQCCTNSVGVHMIVDDFSVSPLSHFSSSSSSSSSVVDEYKIVSTPAFAESISEGDVKWDKSQ